ncbi:MAG: DUF5060 domain-containing protein [Pedosphaera sp.]|nr:DUF5060 domain-containing protein [Pedosphaera sp.]
MDRTQIAARLTALASLGFALALCAAPRAIAPATVPKWSRFELVLQSSAAYTNPPQELTVKATFISPLGEEHRVEGFWDGGRTWRVRFAPDLPGKWNFVTFCSDSANTGLHKQSGDFLCQAALARHALDRHGPIRVARDRRHFEHSDRTPFLWLGDVAWNAARLSEPDDWREWRLVKGMCR